MWTLVGLGNTGAPYEGTRHNIGFTCIDALARRWGLVFKTRKNVAYARGQAENHALMLVKPLAFMNRSGAALAPFLHFHRLSLASTIVLHDDLDLSPGRIRVKFGGGTSGHKGLRDIDQHLGQDYWRVRIGIGHPGVRNAVESYVLERPSDPLPLEEAVDAISEHIELMLAGQGEDFATKVNHAAHL